MSPSSRGERAENAVLVLILLVVAGFAGAASFTHVKTWTLDNSPFSTPEWFGWANAVISELVPTASALVIRRRRRVGASIGYPLGLLIAAVALSLAAQCAVAKPSISGWLLSAVPALAFVALTKLVLSTQPAASFPALVPKPAVSQPSTADSVSVPVTVAETATPPRANGHVIASGVIR